jgi:Zn-finger nucleic acid-binding protein
MSDRKQLSFNSVQEPVMANPAAGMPCPVCQVPLVMSERQGVEIDYCPQCRGVWLDRGELDKIIERSTRDSEPAAPPPPPQAPGYGQAPYPQHHQSGYGHGGYRKRKKSFLEELFD